MIEFYGQTDVGRRRPLNEDSILTEIGLCLVCDGMGGHKAGEVASQLAVEAIAAFVERSRHDREMTWPYGFDPGLSFEANRLRTAIKLANRAIYRKAASGDDYTGMGTTVVAVIVSERVPRITYAHVGDSRAYVLGGGALVQLTRDDSWANAEWGDAVDEAEAASMKNILTKALGAREDVEFEVVDRPLEPGEIILLCSDGLTGMVSDDRIAEIITASEHDLKRACGDLIAEANASGGRDNVSVVLIRHRP
jgi:protein phosphatase